MTPEEHWQRVQVLFDAALQRDPAERGPYLNQACAGDRELKAEVEELLAHDAQATNEDFLATPVLVSEGVDVPSFTEPAESVVRYSPRGLHARGGLGEIHTAWDEQLHRQVALKCIQARHTDNPESLRRFLVEAEVTAKLEHPGIVPVHSLAHSGDGRPYYVMRFIQGETFKEAVQCFHEADKPGRKPGERSLAFRQLLSRFIAVCNTVAYAHSQGILHRDLKPDNIMLGPFGETLLLDWGLAKRFRQEEGAEAADEGPLLSDSRGESGSEIGRAMGTPAYMSPEQAAGQWNEVGPASDIYGLGATLYVLLTGKAPFPSGPVEEILARVKRGDFPFPRSVKRDTPRALEAICLKAMALKPEDRYTTVQELAADLEHWLADEPVSAYREPLPGQLRRWARRHRVLVTGSAAAVLVAVASLGAATVQLNAAYREVEQQRDKARERFRMAQDAVYKYHTSVSQSPELRAHGLEQLRTTLLEAARDYYETFVRQEGNDIDVLAEQGRAYSRLAELYGATGRNEQAEAAYQEALVIQRPLADNHPQVPKYQQDLAYSQNNLGILYQEIGRTGPAKECFEEALAIRQKLVDSYPSVPEYQDDLAVSHYCLGFLHYGLGDKTGAEKAYQAARDTRTRLVRDYPAVPVYQHRLAGTHNNLGILYSATERPEKAEEAYQTALGIFAKLVRDHPGVPEYEHGLAATHNNLGMLYSALPDRQKDAAKAYQEALGLRVRLARAHPSVPDYQSDLASVHNNLASLYRDMGRLEDAEKALKEAWGIFDKLTTAYPSFTDYAVYRGTTSVNLGDLLRESGKPEVALDWFANAIQTLRGLHKQHDFAQLSLRAAYDGQAQALSQLGRHAEALTAWDQAIELAAGPERDPLCLARAATLARLGRYGQATTDAEALIGKATGSGQMLYLAARVFALAKAAVLKDVKLPSAERDKLGKQHAARAVELLRKAHAAEFFKAADSLDKLKKDKDLDPLRSLPEFQQLVTELEAKAKAEKP
jgi:serine/threonine-protein kinase